MSDVIVALDFPIQDGEGKTITELKIRRPKAKDIRKMKGNTDIEQSISLLSIVTGLVPEDLDELLPTLNVRQKWLKKCKRES